MSTKRPESLAQFFESVATLALDVYRERVILGFNVVTDGLADQYRKDAFEVLRFFEQQTDQQMWEQLQAIPDEDTIRIDPETGQMDLLGVRSLAETWLEQWEHLADVLRPKQKEQASANNA